MITANLTGNLGNHMWQYSVCRIIAELKNYDYGFASPTHDYHKGMNQMYFMNVDFGKPLSNINNVFYERWINHQHVDLVNITTLDKNLYNIQDNTCMMGHNGAFGGLYQSEDYLIDRKNDILKWFEFNENYVIEYENRLKENNITLDDDTCVINFRGGEYNGLTTVLLRHEYWVDAINHMKILNPNMKFIVITDDPVLARKYMPFDIPTYHFDIGMDFYSIAKAKWLIISNSSFGWWAAWLNTHVNKIIAPKYWARHNVSDGYWATGDMYTRSFHYLDREGVLFDYETCKNEALEYYKNKNMNIYE
jgi:hypothetical protein